MNLRDIIERIRKFGLHACDLPTMLWNVAVLLRVLTVNIDSKHKTGIPIFFYILTYVCLASHLYVYLISMIWFVFWRCTKTGEVVQAMVVLSLGISTQIGGLKLIYMVLHLGKIRKIAASYLECDSKVDKTSRFYANLLKTLKIVKRRAFFYWMVLVGNGVVYLGHPVVLSGRNLPENYYVIYGLEPMFESPNYEIAYFLTAAGVFFVVYVPATVTAYLIVIVGYTESQVLALSEEILNVWPDAIKQAGIERAVDSVNDLKRDEKIEVNKIIEKNLKSIIIRHAVFINLFLKVEIVFRGAIAMGFVLLIFALISELLGKLENTILQMPFALMQVTMDCVVGQRLMDASDVLEQAVYDSKWENFDVKNMKLVLVILQSSQKTLTLSAGGITMLSFSCLMSAYRAIYSAYNALRVSMK